MLKTVETLLGRDTIGPCFTTAIGMFSGGISVQNTKSIDRLECGIYVQNTWSISRFECGLKLVEQEMKCIPWYLPQVSIPY